MTAATEKFRYWIDMSMECVRRDHTTGPGDQTGPFRTARAMGMALAALNDANALASGRRPLLMFPAPAGFNALTANQIDVASGAACAQVLRLRYPNQANLLEPAWKRWLDYHGYGLPGSPAEVAGRSFGTSVHNFGSEDVVNAAGGQYVPSGDPYTHIHPPTQPMQGYAGAKWGQSEPLLANRVIDFPRPPGRVSATVVNPTPHYAADFARTYAKGDINSGAGMPGSRTLREEVIGIAWGYDGPSELGTPPRLYLQVVLNILDAIEARTANKLKAAEELEIIAAVGIAMADASIDAWHYKYEPTHMMWRPAVGVRRAVPGNGTADPNFLPLGRPDTNGTGLGLTPDFPAYPSGHATFGAAAFQLLRLFLKEKGLTSFDANGVDKVRFDFVSDEYDGRNKDPRTLQPRDHLTLAIESLWDAIIDNSVSRVYLGVHWQFDGVTKRNAAGTDDEFGIPSVPSELGRTGGVWLGAQIANQIAIKLGVSLATIAASKM
jgi:hypothetical protein